MVRISLEQPPSVRLRQNYQENVPDVLKVKGNLIIPGETTPIDNVVDGKDVLRYPLSYGGWREIVQASKHNDISKDLFSMDNLDEMKVSVSEIVESGQQNNYKYTNSSKDNQQTSTVDVKRKRLENPSAQADYTENNLLDEDLPVENAR